MTHILVVGTGSIGRRHIGNLLQLGVGVSAYRYRSSSSSSESLPDPVGTVADLPAALMGNFQGVVIANRTDLHMDTALQAARNGKGIYLEKPVSNSLQGCEELLSLEKTQGLVVEIGCMLRFHPNILWIKNYLQTGELGEVYYARAAVGQYLPDWRPGTDHRQSYSARRSYGGGAIFDLVHEIDLIEWLFGKSVDVAALVSTVATLQIETEALAQIVLRTASGVQAQIHLDYLRPGYARTLEIVGSRGAVTWDYVAGTVVMDSGDAVERIVHHVPDGFQRNDMFATHMRRFVERLADDGRAAACSLAEGISALRVALACHRSAQERRFIRPEELTADYRVTGG